MYNNFSRAVHRLRKDEAGITALETAIILIAFVVVASVFAFTILSAGTYSTERGKEAIYSGLAEVRSSMEIKGSVIITSTATGISATVASVIFTVGNAMGGEAVNFSEADDVVTIEYRDATQRKTISDWTVTWIGNNDGDDLLETGELAEITVPLDGLSPLLGVNTEFTLEIKPPTGAVLNVQRTTPAYMELVFDLQ